MQIGCWWTLFCELDGARDVVAARTVARSGSWLVYHLHVGDRVMMLLASSWVRRRHDAVNSRMMLHFITLLQDDLWLWYHHSPASTITMMLFASP